MVFLKNVFLNIDENYEFWDHPSTWNCYIMSPYHNLSLCRSHRIDRKEYCSASFSVKIFSSLAWHKSSMSSQNSTIRSFPQSRQTICKTDHPTVHIAESSICLKCGREGWWLAISAGLFKSKPFLQEFQETTHATQFSRTIYRPTCGPQWTAWFVLGETRRFISGFFLFCF